MPSEFDPLEWETEPLPPPEPVRDLADFAPVPLKGRRDGWTVAKQREFIRALEASGSVATSLEAVGMKAAGAYRLRARPGAEEFARAWDDAVDRGARKVGDVLIDQAINGIPEPVFYAGHQVAEKRRFNHRTMMWVMQHHQSDKYPGGSTLERTRMNGKHAQPSKEEIARMRREIARNLDKLFVHHFEGLIGDPAKRAAHEVIEGPQDWERIAGELQDVKARLKAGLKAGGGAAPQYL